MNSVSIGIEIGNPGKQDGAWVAYNPAQIQTLITLLKDIVARHQIKPPNIVGHSDIAPQRKIDPGPMFPWQELAQQGLGRWYDDRSEEHTSELQSLMRISYAVFCLKKKNVKLLHHN